MCGMIDRLKEAGLMGETHETSAQPAA